MSCQTHSILPFPSKFILRSETPLALVPLSFHSSRQVFSSNFSRTQQSAQGLLHGLGAHELARGGQVPVVVREESACTIHMYDNNPRIIQEEVGKVLTAPSFLARQDQQEVRDEGVLWAKCGIIRTRTKSKFLAAQVTL